MILIDAVYVNTGGGKALLQDLLSCLRGKGKFTLLCDPRLEGVDIAGYEVIIIPPREITRRDFYRRNRHALTRVFCFGNVPPPFRLEAEVAVYFHNVLLCCGFKNATLREEISGIFKMAYIRWRRKNADVFLVQTKLVKSALRHDLGSGVQICELPFYPTCRDGLASRGEAEGKWLRYAYVSNGYPHKNHACLIAAWEMLAKNKIYPELHLTLYGEWGGLYAQIKEAQAAGARITNHGFTDSRRLYEMCGYQIYPSQIESFGLGLVEAAEAGCAVIASDLPYVHAAIVPFRVFDPRASEFIYEAVVATHGKAAPPSKIVATTEIGRLVHWLAAASNIKGQMPCEALLNKSGPLN